MFAFACCGLLSRRRWASAFSQRAGPLARPSSPSETALALNSSNKGTGSGDAHSPSSHALYQPTEPETPSLTSAIQLLSSIRAAGPGIAEAEPPARAVRKGRVDPAAFEMPVDAIEDAADAGCDDPRDQAPARREAAIAMHQMCATRAHDGAVMNWNG